MLRQVLCLCLYFLPFFASFTLTRADYIMDDTNSSITYLPSKPLPGCWSVSGPGHYYNIGLLNGTTANIDYAQVYNQTVTLSICNSSIDCQIIIPFTGSGTTIHAVQLDVSINYTIFLDDIQQTLPESFPAISDTNFAYNVTLYDNSSLPFAYHNLVLHNTGTLFLFDSAYVKEPEPSSASTTSTSSAIASSSSSPFPSPSSLSPSDISHKPSHVGAIAGGAAGGLVALGVIGSAIAMFLSRRRRNQWAPSSEFEVQNTQPVDAPLQSPPVPPMTQENHHSSHGVGAQIRFKRYDPSDPNTYPTPETGHTSSSGLAPRNSRDHSGFYNYVPEI